MAWGFSLVLLMCAVSIDSGGAGAQARTPGGVLQDTTRDSALVRTLAPVQVMGRRDDLVGVARSASEGHIGALDLRSRPIAREGELLETIPGVVVTQHSGEGKANQYFVRGFNLDHGTDFQTRVEGMPVNLPTHGHGQGYTDLNFITPELVDHLEYSLGVYHAELGDFGSAGAAEFHLKHTLDDSFVTLEGGQHGLARAAAGASTSLMGGDLLVGGEGKAYDGPWLRAQRLRKVNGLTRYTRSYGSSSLSILALAYRNVWNANDQVPERAVSAGIIDRFGQVDSTDGGSAGRYSLSATWRRASSQGEQEVQLFAIRSHLRLYSNFTFFLDNPERGDQFSQVDRRTIVGGNATHSGEAQALGVSHAWRAGVQVRGDVIDGLGLFRTERQVRFGTVREDRVLQGAAGAFVSSESRWVPWFRSVLGLRADAYRFDVRSDRPANSGRRHAGIVSPKASLVFTPLAPVELYVSGGFGFHSNDARGTTITVDPASGAPAEQVEPLVRSRGGEIGLRAGLRRGLRSTVSVWALNLDSELLFVGDAGATAPSGRSARHGVTFANFYRPIPQLALDADVSFAHARFEGVPQGSSRIPGALEQVVAGGLAWSPLQHGIFGALRVRHLGSYPLTEDNAVRARAATLLNGEVGYRLRSGMRVQASILNLANTRAEDIQYFYASRLRGEPAAGVEGVHSHPVEPRQIRLTLEREF